MKGFANIGNTCYLNAGLQMLIQNKDFCDIILYYAKNSQILTIIAQLINDYYNTTNNTIIPIKMKQMLDQQCEIFTGNDQQDSTEFIIYLLDIIDNEIKKIDSNSKSIGSIFGITINIRVKCKLLTCLNESNNTENNNVLLLDINPNIKTLDEAYRLFRQSEKLDMDNAYFCEKCNDLRIASKKNEIKTWPYYLFIYFKRYSCINNRIIKNNQPIQINIEWRNYSLQGAILHYGGLDGGHYVYVGKQENNKWYLFDDSSYSEITTETELTKHLMNAYWLCYKKCS